MTTLSPSSRGRRLDSAARYVRSIARASCLLLLSVACRSGDAHEHSSPAFRHALALAQARADALAETVDPAATEVETCQLTIDLVDDFTQQSLAGLVRITNLDSGKAIKLEGEFHRALNWYSLAEKTTVRLPRAKVRVEALQGLETLRAERVLDLTASKSATVKLTLQRFHDSSFRDWYGGNTHLHLMKLTRTEADRYLQVVPRSDDLDLVFLSYLRRVPDEIDYISNTIVEESFTGDALSRLASPGVVLANGEELRHNFGRGGEGYGHAMLLGLKELIRPVSLGPGIMGGGTDGVPLQPGLREAHANGATVIWCHNAFGMEGIPSWLSGLVHAQNIFDGGSRGNYEDTLYRYLNLGMRVPFSTGTDWFIYDFARVYVPVFGEFTTAGWLAALREGKSYITNGPLLELETERASIGESLHLVGPNRVTVVARGMGRLDFGALELVHNGKVVRRVPAKSVEGYFAADMRHSLVIDGPGWFALRIPEDVGKTELDHPLFAHTSPIYIEMQGRGEIFRVDTARELVEEMRASIQTIQEKAVFADDAERQRVLDVYESAIKKLEDRIDAGS
jgi:hypothetical protein